MALQVAKLGPLTVSRLGFGTLSLSPLQSSLEVEQGAELLSYAWHQGISFWDTAQSYENYPVLRAAMAKLPQPPLVASKTYAYTAKGAHEALDQARSELDLDILAIMMLHEQEALTLSGHRPALDYFAQARERGIIQAVGVSTHSVACVRAAADIDDIDIIHPLYNKWGVGIHDGTAQDMAEAIAYAHGKGKGIYAMKILGGGTLYTQAREAICHALDLPWLDSIVIGMSTQAEIEYNLALFEGREPEPQLACNVLGRHRHLHIADWCQGCGSCVQFCPQGALVMREGKVALRSEQCILCGYCSRACQHMCLKII